MTSLVAKGAPNVDLTSSQETSATQRDNVARSDTNTRLLRTLPVMLPLLPLLLLLHIYQALPGTLGLVNLLPGQQHNLFAGTGRVLAARGSGRKVGFQVFRHTRG